LARSTDKFFDYPTDLAVYHGNISKKFGYFYFANPKVASTATLTILQTAERDGVPPRDIHDRLESPLMSFRTASLSADEILTGDRFFKFTYVRNPYTRILSCYLDKIVQDEDERLKKLPTLGFPTNYRPTFIEFLDAVYAQPDESRDAHWMSQTRLIGMGKIDYDFIGRQETFGSSFPILLDRLGIDRGLFAPQAGPTHPTGAGKRIEKYIGEEEQKIILALYRTDFRALAYGTDPAMARL
jgi:hypothetical protein